MRKTDNVLLQQERIMMIRVGLTKKSIAQPREQNKNDIRWYNHFLLFLSKTEGPRCLTRHYIMSAFAHTRPKCFYNDSVQ